jgi:hypothetical protein
VDLMLAMFPFEAPLYEKARIPVSYVGHPLADAMALEPDRNDARAQLRLGSLTVPVALLPGSRMSELELHADLFIDTAAELHRRRPELRFFVPLATRETREYFETRLYVKEARELPIKILFGHAHLALYSAEAAIVASGTATLEAALARCPMVITYRLSPLTYRMVRRKALLPYFGSAQHPRRRVHRARALAGGRDPCQSGAGAGQLAGQQGGARAAAGAIRRLHRSLACGHDERLRQRWHHSSRGQRNMPRLRATQTTTALLCGVDEAGPRPLAGASSPPRWSSIPAASRGCGLQAAIRQGARGASLRIRAEALAWAIASASVEEIDRMNILRRACSRCARGRLRSRRIRWRSASTATKCRGGASSAAPIVKADRLVARVSAASILAKTARDAEMREMDTRFPGYGFASHKGYSTPEHLTR